MGRTKSVKAEVLSKGEIVPIKNEGMSSDLLTRLSELTGGITARAVEAWGVLTSGRIPASALRQHEGGGGKQYQYMSHVYGQRMLNASFGWNWDFEVLDYQVHEDYSCSSRCRMTIHIPLGKNNNGDIIWKTRIITEIGSHNTFPRRKSKTGEIVISEVTGKPEMQMTTADLVASSVSRGLVKCLERAFNIGSELKEAEEELTPLRAWNSLLKFGLANGLQREDIINLIKEVGITQENLIDRFHEAYTLVYEKAKGDDKTVPLES